MLMLEARGSRSDGGDGQRTPAAAVFKFRKQVGARDSKSAAQPGHAINLRKSAQHDDVLPGLDQVHGRFRSVGEVNVSFVYQHDGIFRLLGDQLLDVRVRRERSGRIVGRTNVKQSRIGRGSEHGGNVVRVSFCQGDFDHARARNFCCFHSSFITWIAGDVAPRRRGEGENGKMQRLARTRKNVDVFALQALLLRKSVNEFVGEPVRIAPALRGLRDNGGARHVAWPERILIGVDDHRSRWKLAALALHSRCGEERLVHNAKRGGGSCGGGKFQERSAGIIAGGRFLAHVLAHAKLLDRQSTGTLARPPL